MKVRATVDISGFNRGMQGFVTKLGLEAPIVLKKEMGELVKTLVKTTPGADAKKIRNQINRKFEQLSDDRNSNTAWANGGGRVGKSGILWYAVNSDYLSGVAPENDKRNATVAELRQLSYRVTKSGRLNYPIRNHRHQRALIHQTILTRRSTVNKLAAEKVKARGRLKAGWMSAVFGGALTLSGANQPPQWVTRHRQGVKGYFINGLGVKDNPRFTIANTAAGVDNPKNNLDSIVNGALAIRANAMQKNLLLYMSGKKKITDYR